MRKSFAILALATLLGADAFGAEVHVVSQDAIQARLLDMASARRSEQATLESVLATPQAAAIAGTLGVAVGTLKGRLPALTDSELHDLASRAADLQKDPVAGLDPDIKQLLVIFLIVAIVILVLKAVD